MADTRVAPYWELTFDAEGDPDRGQRDRLVAQARERDLTDLVVFAHGWNNDRSMANRLSRRFFEPFPTLAAGVRIGYAGLVWPSMRFTDEPIPDFEAIAGAAVSSRGPGLDESTRAALAAALPGHDDELRRIAELLDEQPPAQEAFDEFGELLRRLAGGPEGLAADTEDEPEDGSGPAMLSDDTAAVCEGFTEALARTGAVEESNHEQEFGFRLGRLWNGARELLRQATYYTMKRRSGAVGRGGLGPALGVLAEGAPDLRVHLVGHSFGARLVAFSLSGLPKGVRCVRSVTLLQGAFSHYAFAERLPHQRGRGGVLSGAQARVSGPVVCCHSRHDSALGVLYPLASRLAGDSAGLLGFDKRWGAMGYGGIQAVDGTDELALRDALRTGRLPDSGCVNVDAAEVVRRGGPPAGAHSDIIHAELARVVLAAGRVG